MSNSRAKGLTAEYLRRSVGHIMNLVCYVNAIVNTLQKGD